MFVWLALLAIGWIFSGGLRKRMKGNSTTVIPPSSSRCNRRGNPHRQSSASRLTKRGTMTTKQRTNHDNFFIHGNQTVPGALAKTRTQTRSISRHKFHHQFARSCTRSMTNPMQPFSNHCASAWLSVNAFIGCKPYPLSKQGFYGSPIARRKLRGVPRDGHATAAQHPARHPAQYPRHVPAMAGQWQRQCRRASVKTTGKTTCLAPDLAAPCPRRKLARRLASNLNHDI